MYQMSKVCCLNEYTKINVQKVSFISDVNIFQATLLPNMSKIGVASDLRILDHSMRFIILMSG